MSDDSDSSGYWWKIGIPAFLIIGIVVYGIIAKEKNLWPFENDSDSSSSISSPTTQPTINLTDFGDFDYMRTRVP